MKEVVEIYKTLACFNRYMVECESATNANVPLEEQRFNRYMVECE